MNYDQQHRRLTFPKFFLLILLLIVSDLNVVQSKSDVVKKASDVLGDEKRVFDANFGHNKNYAIDDCIPLAFGDFNADKIVDIFCRNTIGQSSRCVDASSFRSFVLLGDSIRVMINDDRSPTSKEQYKVNLT